MTGILNILAAVKTAVASATDAYFNLVSLLLPGDGTNGAQNNTFLDSSSNNFTITRNGNTTQGTFSPFSQTGWGVYFDGADSKITVADTTSLEPGTGDFCFETWVWFTANSNGSKWDYLTNQTGGGLTVMRKFDNKLYVEADGVGSVTNSVSTVPINQWVHIAVTRSGTTVRIFFNGVQDVSATSSQNFAGTSAIAYGNYVTAYSGTIPVYMSNIRFVKGSAVYTSNFTPSTTPLTAITNTQLLTAQSNRFIDNSSNAFAITVNGTPSVQAFSPFAPTAAYSAATNGGSGYFDGTGDWLTAATNAALAPGSGNFTVECFVYPIGNANYMGIYQNYTDGLSRSTAFRISINATDNTSLVVQTQASAIITTSTGAMNANAWNHIALVRNGSGSNNLVLYVNGVSKGTATNTTNFSDGYVQVGNATYNAIQYGWNGYISGFRLSPGSAVYTAAFTPPTTPFTQSGALLLNFTNAGILDATGKNALETVGNAQISTTQSKWGGSSMYFDGIGDSVITQAGQTGVFGTGDFTIEGWFRWDSIASLSGVVWSKMSTSSMFWTLYIYPANKLLWGNRDSNILTSTTTLSTGTWYHVAITRQSGTVKMWINGTLEGSATDTSDYNVVGSVELGNSHQGYFTGYIDDFRITNGYARYTANFTAPTAAFALQ